MNHATLIGRLVADPVLTTPKGSPVRRYRLAIDRTASDGADYISIVSFGIRGETDARWLIKGRLVAVAGRLRHSTWTDADGNRRESHEVISNQTIFLDGPRPKTEPDQPTEYAPGEEPF